MPLRAGIIDVVCCRIINGFVSIYIMGYSRISGWRIEPSLIGFTCFNCSLHLIVDLQNDALGAILAPLLLLFLPPHPECAHNILHILPRNPIQMEVRRVQLAAQEKPPLFVRPERRPIVAAITSKSCEIPGGVSEFAGAGVIQSLRVCMLSQAH